MSETQDWTGRAEQLRSRRAELDARLHGIERELDAHQSRDWSELAVEREGDEVLEGVGRSGLQEIRLIDLALERIEAGTYGECVTCGGPISAARLDVLPFTPVCKTCAKG